MQFVTNIQNSFSKFSESSAQEGKLKQNLNQFGLNPTNWTLNFQKQDYALITNTDENDFQFIGKMNSTKTNWEYIKLFNV